MVQYEPENVTGRGLRWLSNVECGIKLKVCNVWTRLHWLRTVFNGKLFWTRYIKAGNFLNSWMNIACWRNNLCKIQAPVYWVVAPRSYVAGYQRFGGPCCLYLHGETLLSYHITRRHNPEDRDLNLRRSENRKPRINYATYHGVTHMVI